MATGYICNQHQQRFSCLWLVLMSNHFQFIARAEEGYKMSGIPRDMKNHIAKSVVKLIKEEPG